MSERKDVTINVTRRQQPLLPTQSATLRTPRWSWGMPEKAPVWSCPCGFYTNMERAIELHRMLCVACRAVPLDTLLSR